MRGWYCGQTMSKRPKNGVTGNTLSSDRIHPGIVPGLISER